MCFNPCIQNLSFLSLPCPTNCRLCSTLSRKLMQNHRSLNLCILCLCVYPKRKTFWNRSHIPSEPLLQGLPKDFAGDSIKKTMVEENNFRVLVVDDDSVVRKMHEMMLSKHGMEVWLAGNGKEAVDLHEAGACFNLILMDLETPIMNGREATRQLRAMGVDSAIVGVTSCTSEREKRNFMAAGLNDCVSKPLSIHKIASFLPFTSTKNVNTHGCTSTSSNSNSNRIDNEST